MQKSPTELRGLVDTGCSCVRQARDEGSSETDGRSARESMKAILNRKVVRWLKFLI